VRFAAARPVYPQSDIDSMKDDGSFKRFRQAPRAGMLWIYARYESRAKHKLKM